MQLDPVLVLHLVSGLHLNDYTLTINPYYHPANISKFSTLLIITKERLQQGTSQLPGVTFKDVLTQGEILA